MSGVRALWQPYVCYGLVAALGMSTAYVPCNATVARWFTRRRGLAIGLASAGGSLGTFVLPPGGRPERARDADAARSRDARPRPRRRP